MGDTVEVRFEVRRAGYGLHSYDELMAWVDWNGNYIWERNENIIVERWQKRNTQYDDDAYAAHVEENGAVPNHNAALKAHFFSQPWTIPEGTVLSTIWLRARVASDTSIVGAEGG